jgi:hypothetical protein
MFYEIKDEEICQYSAIIEKNFNILETITISLIFKSIDSHV